MTAILATWSTIIGLALMFVGGLVLWAYGGRRIVEASLVPESGPEAEATLRFHLRLKRWFFAYGAGIITIGFLLLFAAAVSFFGLTIEEN